MRPGSCRAGGTRRWPRCARVTADARPARPTPRARRHAARRHARPTRATDATRPTPRARRHTRPTRATDATRDRRARPTPRATCPCHHRRDEPAHFLADLETKPRWLNLLADRLAQGNPFAAVPRDVDRVLLLGMGSSRYAAWSRARICESPGSRPPPSRHPSTRAGRPIRGPSSSRSRPPGESAETLDAVERYRGRSPIVALVNDPASTLAGRADVVVEMGAGEEVGGVACRSFQHTGLLLRALEAHLTGLDDDLAGLTRQVAEASADLLRTSARPGCPGSRSALASPDGRLPARPGRALLVGRAGRAHDPRGAAPPGRRPARRATGPTSTST